MESIESLAQSWLGLDKDPGTRQDIEQLLQDGNNAELEKRLRGRMLFGTAGLRAKNEAGFTRMNSLTVIQASQGLAEYVLEQIPDVRRRGVVIGHDARRSGNKFARLAAGAFVQKGVKVWWFNRVVHTPMVPFTVKELHAAAGIMVTASHNPKDDQGYKVYWENGAQIIPPFDQGIAAAIDRNLQPVSWDQTVVDGCNELVEEVSERMVTAYVARVAKFVAHNRLIPVPPFVYTPMHGVGLPFLDSVIQKVTRARHRADLPFHIVPEQAQPDASFPTVKFPNPEEHGALDLAKQTAAAANISLVIATDPDADRLAVAECLPDGTWHQFTGNEVGILLASYIISQAPSAPPQPIAFLNSTVSTRMLSALCAAENVTYTETLTGFKWLANTALRLSSEWSTPTYTTPYAFEEALGYMFTDVLPDKDGVSGAAVFLAAAATWRDYEGLTPYMKMQQLYSKYGYYADANTYLVSPSPATTAAVFEHIREIGKPSHPYPQSIGTQTITYWRDLTTGYDSRTENHEPELPVDSSSQMITFEAGDGEVRVTCRGSGTEPKIKLYIEAVGSDMDSAKAKAVEMRRVVIGDWFDLEIWDLVAAQG